MVVGDVTLTEGALTAGIQLKYSLDNMHCILIGIPYKRHQYIKYIAYCDRV